MVSVIVPTFREARNIKELVERLHAALSNSVADYEVIVVDDDSRDGIDTVINDLRMKSYPISLVVRQGERGLSSAVIRGFQKARGDILVCMDADLSHPPEKVPDLIACFADGTCEFAIGSRYVPGGGADERWGLLRRLNSRAATALARPFTRVKDPMAGFFAIPKHVFNRAEELRPMGFKIGLELLVKCRVQDVREIPIVFMQREHGQSKMGLREQWKYLRHLKLLADFKYGAVSRFIQFCLVGSCGILVDLASYSILLALGWGAYVSRAIAIFVAMNTNFAGNVLLTFRCNLTDRLPQKYVGFILSCSLGALVSWLVSTVVALRTPYFREHLLFAAILGVFAGTATNFGLCDIFVFRRSKDTRSPSSVTSRRRVPGTCRESD